MENIESTLRDAFATVAIDSSDAPTRDIVALVRARRRRRRTKLVGAVGASVAVLAFGVGVALVRDGDDPNRIGTVAPGSTERTGATTTVPEGVPAAIGGPQTAVVGTDEGLVLVDAADGRLLATLDDPSQVSSGTI